MGISCGFLGPFLFKHFGARSDYGGRITCHLVVWAHVERGEQWTLRYTAYMSPGRISTRILAGSVLTGYESMGVNDGQPMHLGLLIGPWPRWALLWGSLGPCACGVVSGFGSWSVMNPSENVAWVAAGWLVW